MTLWIITVGWNLLSEYGGAVCSATSCRRIFHQVEVEISQYLLRDVRNRYHYFNDYEENIRMSNCLHKDGAVSQGKACTAAVQFFNLALSMHHVLSASPPPC